MYLTKFAFDEVAAELATTLSKAENAESIRLLKRQAEAIANLVVAANLFDEAGLEDHADAVTKILESLAWSVPTNDPATSGLTPEKELANLKEHGFPLNLPGDKSSADDQELTVEEDENDASDKEPALEVADSDEEDLAS